jgi:hypothetical protein
MYLDQSTALLISNIAQTNVPNSNCQRDIKNHENKRQDSEIPQKLFLNSLSNETIYKTLVNTFSNWPLITPSASDMISAGWSYTNIADRVMCFYCNALCHKWIETDRPYEIHRLKSPQCPFVLLNEKKEDNTPATNITITTQPNTQVAAGPANTAYALACRRYETFQTWPHTEENPLPSIESFVDAGYFYTGRFSKY